MQRYQSWGRYPKSQPVAVHPVHWASDEVPFDAIQGPVLAHGLGRSYGDVCLNNSGTLIDVTPLDRFLAFDKVTGILKCESGVSLEQILALSVPRGWFLPVTPGTKHVTVGGAIANDVHGKNHHVAGTFGCYVKEIELLRSTGDRIVCSADSHPDLFRATIGGLGLTGLVLSAEIQLRPVSGPFFRMARSPFGSLSEFLRVTGDWDEEYEYTVAWVDSQARGRRFGRGILLAGNHADVGGKQRWRMPRVNIPFDFPAFALNRFSVRILNEGYYRRNAWRVSGKIVHYEPFLFPLDGIRSWNRMYGRRGFLQYQVLVPMKDGIQVIRELLGRVVASRQGAFLAVLKRFGAKPSPGILSFPKKGLTLAVDMPNAGEKTLKLLDILDTLVLDVGGSIYPAKDARMSASSFQRSFPQWEQFRTHIDPRFQSDFWRRVTDEAIES